jgi:hypothetical protein
MCHLSTKVSFENSSSYDALWFQPFLNHENWLDICLHYFREKVMTMPRKQTQRDLRRLEKAEKAAQLEKVFVLFLYIFLIKFYVFIPDT